MSQVATIPVGANGLDSLERRAGHRKVVSRPARRHRNRTLTIIDWDDTILPSHEIFHCGLSEALGASGKISVEYAAILKEIENRALELLERVLTHGLVVVVTASEAGWVERSGSVFLPKVVRFFRKHSIRIVSARSRYERQCGPNEWKVRAFQDEIRGMFLFDKKGIHVVVIGDGLTEYIAALNLKQLYSEMVVKAVKFIDGPNVEQLKEQLSCLESLIGHMFETQDGFFCMGCIMNAPCPCKIHCHSPEPYSHRRELSSYVMYCPQ